MKLFNNMMILLAAISLVACGDSDSDSNASGGAATQAGGAAAASCDVPESPGIGEVIDANKATNCENACNWLAGCAVNTGDCSGYTKCGADDYKAVFDGCITSCNEDQNSLLLKAAKNHTMCAQSIQLASVQNMTLKVRCDDDPSNDNPPAGGAAAAGGAPAAGGATAAGGAAAPAGPTMSIAELAQGNADLSKLVEAVVASDLVGDLGDSSKTFTVFAPTNAAFEALAAVPEGEALKGVLLAHVIENSKTMAADITDGLEVGTLNPNARLKFAIDADKNVTVTLGNVTAKVVLADIEATNGVVHVIDAVLVP